MRDLKPAGLPSQRFDHLMGGGGGGGRGWGGTDDSVPAAWGHVTKSLRGVIIIS